MSAAKSIFNAVFASIVVLRPSLKWLCYIVLTALSLTVNTSLATTEKRVAYSKKFGIEVFAIYQGDNWCHRVVNIELRAANPAIFKSNNIGAFIKKIGAVLPTECDQAHQLDIKGKDKHGQLHLTAKASTKDQLAWQVAILKSAPEAVNNTTTSSTTAPQPEVNSLATTRQPTEKPEKPSLQNAISYWQPPSSQQSIKYSAGAQDFEISTNDWRCKLKINHLNNPREQKLLVLKPQGLGCDENRLAYGQGVANVSFYDGRVYEQLKGNFYLGYHFDYNVVINKKILLHRTRLDKREALTFYLGELPVFDTQLIGVLLHTSQGWSFSNGAIIALTKNKSLFQNTRLIKQFEHAISGKAATISHSTKSYKLYAMNQLDLPLKIDSNMLYTAQFTKQNEQWLVASDSIKNYVAGNINQATQTALSQGSLANRIQIDTKRLKKASLADRLTYLYDDVDQINNPLLQAAQFFYTHNKLKTFVLVKVNNLGNPATVDWPYPIELHNTGQINQLGWYLVWGEVKGNPNKISNNGFLIPQIFVDKVKACEQEACREYNDVTQLVLERYQMTEWQ
ncbi:hypothetical protein [Spartinivicinus poritis]|uniref:Uncharacterized protein n=1 Tax=Spartinivicinus poritis TaxID=2994640 RepID=A0ABT5U4F5_9GAMM|nr:hypothetical protein [Spartinivicinus sp. A2-2]MDE1461238.1 hypothetical protein [Spartinivicinus sp. A2-2]